MQKSILVLRVAVCANLLAIIGTIAADIAIGEDLPPELRVWQRKGEAYPPEIFVLDAFFGVAGAIVMTLLGSIAMLARKKWGAWCFLLGTAAGFGTLILFYGPQVSHGLVNVFDELSTITTGFVLGVAFFSDALAPRTEPPPVPSKEDERQPNHALQTTPMTRSVCEKTTEFGDPQRGV